MRNSIELRVRGMVQGVGFRPAVWRLVTELALDGTYPETPVGVLMVSSEGACAAYHQYGGVRETVQEPV